MNTAKTQNTPGSGVLEPESLKQVRESKLHGRWAVYENVELGHRNMGHVIVLCVGLNRTFTYPPRKAPDGNYGLGWRYGFKGFLDPATNSIYTESSLPLEVITGNVGTVYRGRDWVQAVEDFNEYRFLSQTRYGRAAGEPVTLLLDGEPEFEYVPGTVEKEVPS